MTDTFKLVRNFLKSISSTKDGVIDPEHGIPVNATFGGEVKVALQPGETEEGDNTLVSGKDDEENYVPIHVTPNGDVVMAGANGDGFLPVKVNDEGELVVDTEGSAISDPLVGHVDLLAATWTPVANEPTYVDSKCVTIWGTEDLEIRKSGGTDSFVLESGESIDVATDDLNKIEVKSTPVSTIYFVMC